MATFRANPEKENEPWIENAAILGHDFRNWHLMFFCFAAFLAILILLCCCIRIRVPRTKQQIEADYSRKKLAKKFRERLRLIKNQEMDAIDLQRALEIIQEDYKLENKNLTEQIVLEMNPDTSQLIEPQQQTKFARKFAMIMKATKPNSQSAVE